MVLIVGDWKSLAVRGAAAVLFGLLTLLWPDLTVWALVLLFGAYAFVDGMMALIGAATKAPGTEGRRGILIVHGLAGVAVGAMTVFWPDATALALLYLIAAWALITGIIQLVTAVRLRKVIDNEWMMGLLGVLSIAFAAVLVITPGAGALAITWAIGWFALLAGGLYLGLAWRLRKIQQEVAGGQAARSVRARPAM